MSENSIRSEKLYRVIARKLNWEPTYQIYIDQRMDEIRYIEENHLPHGSGFNTGCKIRLVDKNGKLAYNDQKFFIDTEYHHMDENGFYDGWFGVEVKVTASLQYHFNLDIRITYNDTDTTKTFLKDNYLDYFYQIFDHSLGELIPKFNLS